jgi:hypothetical protein
MRPTLCHFGETVLPDGNLIEVGCNAVFHPDWVEAVKNAGGVGNAFGRCCRCGESADPEASAIRAYLAQAFESRQARER